METNNTTKARPVVAPIPVRKGWRYEATKAENATPIAARIRADIKAAVKAGEIPAAKYSVRTSGSSVHSSINVTIDALPFCAWEIDGDRIVATAPAALVREFVEAIHDAYQRDASDSQTDYFEVRYYGRVILGDSDEREGLYHSIEALARF